MKFVRVRPEPDRVHLMGPLVLDPGVDHVLGEEEGDLMRLGGWSNANMIHERYGASRADARAAEAYARIGAPGDRTT